MLEEKYYDVGNKNIKIAFLSDLHFSVNYKIEIFDKIIDSLNKNKPNYICLSGDIIDEPAIIFDEKISILKKFIKDLSLISQVIIHLGNHDILYNSKKTIEWFNNLKLENVYFLNNKSLIRNELCFIGFNPNIKYYEKEKVNNFINELNNISFNRKYYNILLCHSPINVLKNKTINETQIRKIDLILSGHMHNGLVPRLLDFKGNIGFVSPHKTFFPKYARNRVIKKIDNKKINLIINGGVIKISNHNHKGIRWLNKLYPISIVYIKI